jgi:hypothetical protein
VTNHEPNDLSHLSEAEFNSLCPQGEHAPGPEPLSPAAHWRHCPMNDLSPRQQLIKELDEKLTDAFQSDFEHGVKALNIAAREEFNQKYPALIDVLEWIAFLSYEELPID